jgi:hypothetical protein
MIDEVLKNDYESMRASCIEHEQQLLKLLNKNRIDINVYHDIDEFRQYFLEKTS